MWRVIKNMYDITQSAVLLEGEVSEQFNIGQGVARGCSMSPILFSIFINQLLDEVEKAGIGITVKKDVKVGGLMFADDFVGLTTNAEDLQTLINIVQGFCNKWRLKSNIKKSAVMVFSKEVNTGGFEFTSTYQGGVAFYKLTKSYRKVLFTNSHPQPSIQQHSGEG